MVWSHVTEQRHSFTPDGKELFFHLNHVKGDPPLCKQRGPNINHFTSVENFQYCIARSGYASYYNWIAPCPECLEELGLLLLQE